MRDPIDGIERKLDNIDDRLNDLVKTINGIEESLANIANEAHLASVILACNLPLLVAIEQYKAGTISMDDLGKMFDSSSEIMRKTTKRSDIL